MVLDSNCTAYQPGGGAYCSNFLSKLAFHGDCALVEVGVCIALVPTECIACRFIPCPAALHFMTIDSDLQQRLAKCTWIAIVNLNISDIVEKEKHSMCFLGKGLIEHPQCENKIFTRIYFMKGITTQM